MNGQQQHNDQHHHHGRLFEFHKEIPTLSRRSDGPQHDDQHGQTFWTVHVEASPRRMLDLHGIPARFVPSRIAEQHERHREDDVLIPRTEGYWITSWLDASADKRLVDVHGQSSDASTLISENQKHTTERSTRRGLYPHADTNACRIVVKVSRFDTPTHTTPTPPQLLAEPLLWVHLSKGCGMLTDFAAWDLLERVALYLDVVV